MNDSLPARGVAACEARAGPPAAAGWRRHLLVLRFALFNVVALALAAAAGVHGLLDGALGGDTFWLCAVIVAVFLYGLVLCAQRVVRVNRALDEVRNGDPRADARAAAYLEAIAGRGHDARAMQAGLLRLRLSHPATVVHHVANTLVFLGLVGTVIGFIVALSGVDPQRTASVDEVAPMVSNLINGMSIALYTTLVGAVLHVWLMIGYRMLVTANIVLFEAIVELGERRVGR